LSPRRRILLALAVAASLVSAGESWSRDLKDYSGDDAGFMVMSVGSDTSMGSRAITYTLNFRNKGSGEIGTIKFTPHRPAVPFVGTKRDFDGDDETGFVDVRRLAPGDYEIFGLSAAMYGVIGWHWKPTDEFSIPFTIKPGVGTYLGSFTGIATSKRSVLSLGAPFPTGAYFVVSNREGRDLPIARRKVPALNQINAEVPDVAAVNSRYIQKSCRPEDCG
jgi:hypothetical protein